MNQSTDLRPILTAMFIIFLMLICVLWFGWGRFKFADEEVILVPEATNDDYLPLPNQTGEGCNGTWVCIPGGEG